MEKIINEKIDKAKSINILFYQKEKEINSLYEKEKNFQTQDFKIPKKELKQKLVHIEESNINVKNNINILKNELNRANKNNKEVELINDKIKDLISEDSVIKSRAKSILGLVSFIFSFDNSETSYDEKIKLLN